jgi:hypothetical protein
MSHPARSLLFTLLCIPSAALADPPAVPPAWRWRSPRAALRGASASPCATSPARPWRWSPTVACSPSSRPRRSFRRACGGGARDASRAALTTSDRRSTSSRRASCWSPGSATARRSTWTTSAGCASRRSGSSPWSSTTASRPRAAGSASHARSIVTDERAETFADITTIAPPSLVAVSAPDAATEGTSRALLTLTARGSSASSAAGLRVSVTLRNPSVQAVWTLLRPTQFSFVVTDPEGREVACNALLRQPAPLRDLFARLPARGRRSYTLLASMHCPASTFQRAGVYRARASFESRADGEAFGMQRVFTGIAESASVPLRVSRGQIVPHCVRGSSRSGLLAPPERGGCNGEDPGRRRPEKHADHPLDHAARGRARGRRGGAAHRGHRDDRVRHHRERRRGDAPRRLRLHPEALQRAGAAREGAARDREAAARVAGGLLAAEFRDKYQFENIVGRSSRSARCSGAS